MKHRVQWKPTLATLLVLSLGGCSGGDPDPGGGPDAGGVDASCAATAASKVLDKPYATVAGVKATLLSLDGYFPARAAGDCKPAPVVVWVHGGGWSIGDKQNKLDDKVALFNGLGYVLISVNYRLSPNPASKDPGAVRYPVHPQDVAQAVAWVLDNVAKRGGDPKRVAVLGHSAGAHLSALVTTDGSFLAAHGHKLGDIVCTGSFDTASYDIPTYMKSANASAIKTYTNAFGNDAKVWKQASPLTHVAKGKGIGDFLLAGRGGPGRLALAKDFTDALKAAGSKATIIDASSLDHSGVNDQIGKAGDTVMTAPIKAFLKGCFGK